MRIWPAGLYLLFTPQNSSRVPISSLPRRRVRWLNHRTPANRRSEGKTNAKTRPHGRSTAFLLEKALKTAIFFVFVLYFRAAVAYDRDD
jgi:hypothetical protein